MSFWITDPELFLYAKGTGRNDVHLWRCKKPASSSSSSSPLVVPMESDDFDYVSKVKNYVELIQDLFDWDKTDYKRLVKYIYENHLLVNSQGFVIAVLLHEADKDGNKKIDDADDDDDEEEEEEEKDAYVPAAIYIRSLDVLPLKPYIPNLMERPIPLRTVKYLGDVNGKAATMEDDSIVTKLTARVDHLEAENNTLDSNVKTLEGQVTKLTVDLVTQMNALTTLQQQQAKNINENPNIKEAWMTDFTNSAWVGVEGLRVQDPYDFTIIGPLGTFTTDDNGTNVRARYWYKVKAQIAGNPNSRFFGNLVSPEDLTPNKENARFSLNWVSFKSKGKSYVLRKY